MCVNLVKNIKQRKVKPLHPGSIVIDVLEDRGISIEEFSKDNIKLKEILEGRRPVTYRFAFELELRLGIAIQLLLNLQRKVDIWDSLVD
jgi:Plasmid maintenance system antidote protein